MKVRDDALLRDMLRSANLAREFLGLRSLEELKADDLRLSAILYRLQLIGEAANHLSVETRDRHEDGLDFAGMIGLRHVIVHGYAIIDVSAIWAIVVDDVPEVISALEQILSVD